MERMRGRETRNFVRIAATLLACAASLAAQPGGIEGTVVNQATGEPLAGVHLRFYASMFIESATQAYGALSAAGGHFSIDSLPPGNYTVELERTGLVQAPGAGFMRRTELALQPGQRIAGYQLFMRPLTLVSGRVLDAAGAPAPGATVAVTEDAIADQVRTPSAGESFGIAAADERGQFRLFAVPGKYYLAAWLPMLPFSSHPPGGANMLNSLPNGATVTYYPDALDPASATALEVKPGAGFNGLTIRLHGNAPRVSLTVTGVVTGIPPGALATVRYHYWPGGSTSSGGGAPPLGPDGAFSIRNLGPGRVQLMAAVSSGDTQLQSDIVEIPLDAGSAPKVTLALRPGGLLTGAVEVAGANITAAGGKLSVRLSPSAAPVFFVSFPLQNYAVGADGAFRAAGLAPGRYQVSLQGLPENAYIQSIAVNGAAVAGDALDFSQGLRSPAPAVKITIGLNGAQIAGDVRNADGSALLMPNQLSVFLVAESDPQTILRGATASGGHYVVRSVPPGRYKIYAADLFNMSLSSAQLSAARVALAAAADRIEVKEGDRLTRDLTAATKEALRANPGQ
jgi:hypothetical protein